LKTFNSHAFNDYLLLLLLVGTTGFSFFYKYDQFVVVLLIYSLVIFFSRKQRFDKGFLWFVLFLVLLQIGLGIKFSYWPIKTFIGLHIRMFAAYFTVKSIGKSFVEKYVKFITFFSIISFIVFIPLSLSPGLVSFFVNNIAPLFKLPFAYKSELHTITPTILIYNLGTFGAYLFPRNCGPFWEPGAFAGFLIIAIVFELIINNNIFSKRNIINIVALVTTFSTTGYLALFFIFFIFYGQNLKIKSIIIFGLLSVLVIQLYSEVPFLKNKIDHALMVTETNKNDKFQITRFQSAIFDMNDFMENPIIGTGRNYKTRYSNYSVGDIHLTHRNNGLTNLLATYGLIFFIFYWRMYYKSFKTINAFYQNNMLKVILIIGVFFIIGFSEPYFLRPLFYSFLFLFFVYGQNSNSNSHIQPARVASSHFGANN
jgi:hypothetical protein